MKVYNKKYSPTNTFIETLSYTSISTEIKIKNRNLIKAICYIDMPLYIIYFFFINIIIYWNNN